MHALMKLKEPSQPPIEVFAGSHEIAARIRALHEEIRSYRELLARAEEMGAYELVRRYRTEIDKKRRERNIAVKRYSESAECIARNEVKHG